MKLEQKIGRVHLPEKRMHTADSEYFQAVVGDGYTKTSARCIVASGGLAA